MSRHLHPLDVCPRLPPALSRLDELARNLAYAWDPRLRAVFARLDPALWNATGKTPRRLLRQLAQSTLDRAAQDEGFLAEYGAALAALDSQRQAPPHEALAGLLGPDDLVAYFCAEFGLHESLPIYSGGLGVLAGDHCKAASDLGVPLVAVGLLYGQGYFTQTLDAQGRQHASAHESDFEELPVALCRDAAGQELRVALEVADRPVQLRLWEAQIGRIRLVLLDSDVPDNDPAERGITHQLYGGDADLRIRQEMVLGIGGVRALKALGLSPTVWHCNEGHAAFLALERLRERVAQGDDFDTALEGVSAAQVFTTHTPVAAGHDVFQAGQVRWHLRALLPQLGASEERVLALGSSDPLADPHHGRFNMTTLALRTSRFHNGVSRVHGRVARKMERGLWPQLRAQDVPIRHVTNGIHLPTFLGQPWQDLLDRESPGWREHADDPARWQALDRIDDARFAAVRRELKASLLQDAAARLRQQFRRNGVPHSLQRRATAVLEAGGDPLVLGFARRFATYKRAALLLSDEPRLARLLNDPRRPALLLVAGKAHPRDLPGQALIQQLWQASLRPEFIGRLLVLEGYDLRLARHLVQGSDVWLNTPEFPLEACGTSGMKAAVNGCVNVSVLDGWWDEAWSGEGEDRNGFAIHPAEPLFFSGGAPVDDSHRRARDEEEARQLLDILEHEVAPLYYGGEGGAPYGAGWLKIARASMKSLGPRFNSARMVLDYVRGFYGPAAHHGRALSGPAARGLAAWKQRVRSAWGGVSLRTAGPLARELRDGEPLALRLLAQLNGLAPEDVAVEVELGRREGAAFLRERIVPLQAAGRSGDETVFEAAITPLSGAQHLRLRMRPHHAALAHPFEMGLVAWT